MGCKQVARKEGGRSGVGVGRCSDKNKNPNTEMRFIARKKHNWGAGWMR